MSRSRRDQTCDLCEQRIPQGDAHYAYRMTPWEPGNETGQFYTFRAHPLCWAFYDEVLRPEFGEEPVWDWQDAQREHGFAAWLARREAVGA